MGGQCGESWKAQWKSVDTEDGLGQEFDQCSYGMLHTWENQRKKNKIFGNELFHVVSCIPQNEMVVLARDMNRHVGSNTMERMVVTYFQTCI